MKKKRIKLVDGSTAVINDNEWASVINKKWFDEKATEIVRVSRHLGSPMTRIYVMRSQDGKKAAETNRMVFGDDFAAVLTQDMKDCGVKHISDSDVVA